MAKLIKANSETSEQQPANGGQFTLAEMNAFVGGYLEAVNLFDGSVMYVNEEGIRLQLPINEKATALVRQKRPTDGWVIPILGDVIVCTLVETGDSADPKHYI